MIYNDFPFDVGMGPNDLHNSLINDEVRFPDLGPGLKLPSECSDLINRMLDKDPTTRITISEVTEHPYLQGSLSLLPSKLSNGIYEWRYSDPTTMVANIFKKIISRKLVELEMKKQEEDVIV